MRILAALGSLLVLVAVAPDALAHGGGGFRDAGRRPAPTLECDCAKADCPACAAKRPAEGEFLTQRTPAIETIRSWGELAEVRVGAELTTTQPHGLVEALVRIEHGPILAVTAGGVTGPEVDLRGVLQASQSARRDYLWERRRLRDPMLVQREDAAAVSMRVCPIPAKGTMRATLTAFTLLAPPSRPDPRFYRTADRVLVIRPRTPETEKDADFVDEQGGRVLLFLPESACRARWPGLIDRAYRVPCVPAIEAAVRGKGAAAVTEETALVALPPGSHAPADLFVGPIENAPRTGGRFPQSHEPSDPPPPPPPPADVPPRAAP
jgi:hypothetical protein